MTKESESPFNFDRKKWLHTGGCYPQTAASLILGIDPDKCIVEDPDNYRNVRVKFDEVQELSEILCDGRDRPWWRYSHLNIFHHVNKGIRNRHPIDEMLLKDIKDYFLNLIEEEQNQFGVDYRYIKREIDKLLFISIADSEKKTKIFSHETQEIKMKPNQNGALDSKPLPAINTDSEKKQETPPKTNAISFHQPKQKRKREPDVILSKFLEPFIEKNFKLKDFKNALKRFTFDQHYKFDPNEPSISIKYYNKSVGIKYAYVTKGNGNSRSKLYLHLVFEAPDKTLISKKVSMKTVERYLKSRTNKTI